MKVREYDDADWGVCDNELSEIEIRVATKDRVAKSTQGELDNTHKDNQYILTLRQKKTESKLHIKSKKLQPLRQIRRILAVIRLQGSPVLRIQALGSY